MEKKVTPNKQEFVVMSVDGYKKLANIDYTGRNQKLMCARFD